MMVTSPPVELVHCINCIEWSTSEFFSVTSNRKLDRWYLATAFQHDTDPKHTSQLVVEWIKFINLKPKTSPDHNPVGNLWTTLKNQTHARKPTNELIKQFCQKTIDKYPAMMAIKSIWWRCNLLTDISQNIRVCVHVHIFEPVGIYVVQALSYYPGKRMVKINH